MKKKKGRSIVVSVLVYFFAGIGSCLALLLLLILFMPQPYYHDGFRSLNELEAYAKTLNEHLKMDTENTIKPDFSSYYKTLAPTWKTKFKAKFKHILELVHLAKPPIWSASFFKTQLDSLITSREVKNYKDQFICKLTAKQHNKFVLFGNVQGSFHSLVRCLAKLNKLGILSNDLKIVNPDDIIIFIGDVVDRSPFTMDTLSVVCKLLSLNPDNVIYMRGNHESNNYWQEHTLKTELQIRAALLSKSRIPLADEVNRFFNTLPLAIYITPHEGSHNVIRISNARRSQNKLLHEQDYAQFLTGKSSGSYACFNVKNSAESDPSDTVNVKVIFEGEKKRENYQPHDGLRLLAPDMGSIAWTVLSCPNMVYQKALKFFYDAFVIITPAKELDDWTITLYNRDVRTKSPFKATTFSLLTGTQEGTNKKPTEKVKKEKGVVVEKEEKKETKEKKDKEDKRDKKTEKKEQPPAPPLIQVIQAAPTPQVPQKQPSAFEPIVQQVPPPPPQQAAPPEVQRVPIAQPTLQETTTTIAEEAEAIDDHAKALAEKLRQVERLLAPTK